MPRDGRQKVSKCGRVPIPKWFCDRFNIEPGDYVRFYEESGNLVIAPPVTKEELAEGYSQRAERDRELVRELTGVSSEADAFIDERHAK